MQQWSASRKAEEFLLSYGGNYTLSWCLKWPAPDASIQLVDTAVAQSGWVMTAIKSEVHKPWKRLCLWSFKTSLGKGLSTHRLKITLLRVLATLGSVLQSLKLLLIQLKIRNAVCLLLYRFPHFWLKWKEGQRTWFIQEISTLQIVVGFFIFFVDNLNFSILNFWVMAAFVPLVFSFPPDRQRLCRHHPFLSGFALKKRTRIYFSAQFYPH